MMPEIRITIDATDPEAPEDQHERDVWIGPLGDGICNLTIVSESMHVVLPFVRAADLERIAHIMRGG